MYEISNNSAPATICGIFIKSNSVHSYTVFIQINAQPRISANLEKAPILKAEKVNKRPALNKRPPRPPPPNQTQVSAHPHTTQFSE